MRRYIPLLLVAVPLMIWQALVATVKQRTVTYDLARQIEGAREVKCSEFAQAIVDNIA